MTDFLVMIHSVRHDLKLPVTSTLKACTSSHYEFLEIMSSVKHGISCQWLYTDSQKYVWIHSHESKNPLLPISPKLFSHLISSFRKSLRNSAFNSPLSNLWIQFSFSSYSTYIAVCKHILNLWHFSHWAVGMKGLITNGWISSLTQSSCVQGHFLPFTPYIPPPSSP